MATTYLAQGNLKEAGKLMVRAVSIWEKTLGPDHPSVALGFTNLAAISFARHKYKEAVEYDRRALAVSESHLPADHPQVIGVLNNLGAALFAIHQYEEAEALLERAIALSEKARDPNYAFQPDGLKNLADVYRFQQHDFGARE